MGSNGAGTYAKVRGGSGHLASWAQELVKVPIAGPVRSLAFGPGNKLAVCHTSAVKVYSMPTGELDCSLNHDMSGDCATVLSVAFAHDGVTIATCCADGSACLWDSTAGSMIQIFGGHNGPVHDVALSVDGRVATAKVCEDFVSVNLPSCWLHARPIALQSSGDLLMGDLPLEWNRQSAT